MTNNKQLIDSYIHACEMELQAFKVGNVSVYADGHDMTVEDFRKSANVSANPLCCHEYSLGEKIFYAVQATREAVGCNTNLGIILLCAPLIEAAQRFHHLPLPNALEQVLKTTTVADANWVFKAIELANPAGLGHVEQQDVSAQATVTLTQAMQLASEKDRIALQYVKNYKDILEFSVLRYNCAFAKWHSQEWAVAMVHANLLGHFPDSHIERKYGKQYTPFIAHEMTLLSDSFANADDPKTLLPLLYELDKTFKARGLNPGTTADMVVATVLVVTLSQFNIFSKSLNGC